MGGGMMGMCPAMASAPPSLMMIDRNAETLGLTADQKTKLTAALTKHDTNLGKLRTAAQQASKALHDAIYAPTFDSAKVNTLLAAAQKADAAISTANVQSWTEIRSILTPAQVAALSEATTRRMGGFGGETRQNQNRDRARPGTGGARGGAPNAQ
jgi:Spy/CpxP family protein refolding chaperone